ncbi:MAG: histone acetyltransferase [Burkholderiaceae bacterium]|nr:histone acetyltransferase [Burkholderiaceae bacterium]
MEGIQLRNMREPDIAAVFAIQREQYGDGFIEPDHVLSARLAAFPQTAWVAADDAGICAYLVGYPSVVGQVTPLGGIFAAHEHPDTMYLHDLAVARRATGSGVAGALIRHAWRTGIGMGVHCSSLVSVQDSQAFWRRHGYGELGLMDERQQEHLATYGQAANYMVRTLD